MPLAPPSSWSTPTQGLLGGLGLASASSTLLLFTGKSFGVSGFIHRSFRPQSASAIHDAIAVLGLLVGGAYVGALEAKYISGDNNSSTILPSGDWTWDTRSIALSVLAGFLSGLGSKLQNGCTSGHMICGLARFSLRSTVATLVFFVVAAAVAQFHRPHLNALAGYDWNLDAIDGILIWTYAGVVASLILAVTILAKLQPGLRSATFKAIPTKLVSFGTAIAFGLALRLSTLSDPAKVITFLITPFPDPTIFDPTLAFLALGALPLAALVYHLSNSRRSKDVLAIKGKKAPQFPTYIEERDPIVNSDGTSVTSFETPEKPPRFPLLATGSWPDDTLGTIDARLIIGAVLFGVGWGIKGLCPGPAVLNFGVSIYNLSRGVLRPEAVHQAVWLSSFVLGGFAAV